MRIVPKKQKGQGCGPRRINGAMLDVAGAADFIGVTPNGIRARVARHRIPYRRDHGRIVFLKAELEVFMQALPVGCSVEDALACVHHIGE